MLSRASTGLRPAVPQLTAAFLLAAVALAACTSTSEASGPPISATPTSTSEAPSPPASATAEPPATATATPGPVTLTFSTFGVPFAVTLPVGYVKHDDTPGVVSFDYRPDTKQAPIWTLQVYSLAATTLRGAPQEIPWPDDLLPWLRTIPEFHDVGKPVPVTVAGIAGTSVDVLVDFPAGSPPDDCPHLVGASAIYWNNCPSDEPGAYRFWTAERGAGTGFGILLTSTPARFAEAASSAQEVIDSMVLR